MRSFLLLFFLIISSYSVNAQAFGYKMIAGFNFCQIDGDRMGGYNKLGYRFGIATFIPVKEKDEIGLEITYSVKGSRTANNPDNPPPFIVKYSYGYVEFPLYYQKQIKKFGVRAALVPGYLVKGKADLGGGFTNQTNLKKFELSGLVGANYKINDHLAFYMHYQYSITSIIDQAKPQSGQFLRTGVYNNIISAGLQLSFN